MKLFILAALIAISSAARLEHLEQQRGLKEYLPPVQSGHGQFGGQSGFGHSGSHGSGFASQGSNSLDSGDSAGFGSAPQGLKAGAGGAHGFSSFDAARSNQYLPPDHGPSGSSGFNKPSGGASGQDAFGASSNQFGSQSQFGPSHGFGTHGSSSFGPQGSNSFGSHGSNAAHGSTGFGSHGSSGFGTQGSSFGPQGSHGFGSQGSSFGSQGSSFGPQGSHGFGSQGSSGSGSQGSSFGSQGSSFGSQGSRGQQNQLRQYLAPKASSSHDNVPQQAFDEQTGYIY